LSQHSHTTKKEESESWGQFGGRPGKKKRFRKRLYLVIAGRNFVFKKKKRKSKITNPKSVGEERGGGPWGTLLFGGKRA